MKKTVFISALVCFMLVPLTGLLAADTQYYDTSGQKVSEAEYREILEKWYEFIEAEKEKKRQAEPVRKVKTVQPPVVSKQKTPPKYRPVRRKPASRKKYSSDDYIPTPKAPSRPKRDQKFTNKLRLMR